MNEELDNFLYKKELKECTDDCKIKRFLRNGYCPNCDGKNFWVLI